MLPILLALAFIFLLLVVLIAGQPEEFIVTRSVKISAPPERIFPHINDFHQWESWSPWAKLDPACKINFEGAPAGQEAIFSWDGNHKVGAGRMTIFESRPVNFIGIKLEFFRPFKAINTSQFTFLPENHHTVVTWTMLGKNNFMSKVMGLFMNCNKMVGGDFEKGLAAMKSVTEVAT